MRVSVLSILILLFGFSSALSEDLVGLVKHDSEILGWIELREESLEALALLSDVGLLPVGGNVEYVERSDFQARCKGPLAESPLVVGTQSDKMEERLAILGDVSAGQIRIESAGGEKALKVHPYVVACY